MANQLEESLKLETAESLYATSDEKAKSEKERGSGRVTQP